MRYATYTTVPKSILNDHEATKQMINPLPVTPGRKYRFMRELQSDKHADNFVHNRVTIVREFEGFKAPRISFSKKSRLRKLSIQKKIRYNL